MPWQGTHNNAAERALKRVAIGRKNWLFAGHDAAALNHARLWTMIASAERHGIDPQRYLTSLLAKLPPIASQSGSPSTDELTQFLPDVWKREDASAPNQPSTEHVPETVHLQRDGSWQSSWPFLARLDGVSQSRAPIRSQVELPGFVHLSAQACGRKPTCPLDASANRARQSMA